MTVEILDSRLGTPVPPEHAFGIGDCVLLVIAVCWIITMTQVTLPILMAVSQP